MQKYENLFTGIGLFVVTLLSPNSGHRSYNQVDFDSPAITVQDTLRTSKLDTFLEKTAELKEKAQSLTPSPEFIPPKGYDKNLNLTQEAPKTKRVNTSPSTEKTKTIIKYINKPVEKVVLKSSDGVAIETKGERHKGYIVINLDYIRAQDSASYSTVHTTDTSLNNPTIKKESKFKKFINKIFKRKNKKQ